MKRIIILGLIALIVAAGSLSSCISNNEEETPASKPLNISIYLDLSDRLVRDLTPDQTYRDTAIINYLVDYFKSKTLGPAILKSENKMKVFFYPTPNSSEISTLANGLNVDIAMKEGVQKRMALEEMKSVFQENLRQIYEETIKEKNWVGCDIWGFFSKKKVDNLCVKPNARNVIVILTDGYIFHEDNKIQEGDKYSFITPKVMSKVESLIDRRNGDLKGKGLEVLMLEVNPTDPKHYDKMENILETWFTSMGVEKFVMAETDANLTNTETIIKNFLDN